MSASTTLLDRCSAAGDEVVDNHYDGDHQQRVDKRTDVSHEEAERPKQQKQKDESPQHVDSPFNRRSRIGSMTS